MLKKIIFMISVILIFLNISVYASDSLSKIIDNELELVNIENFDIKEFKNDIIEKGELPGLKGIFKKIIELLLKETGEHIKILLVLIVPILLMGVLSNLSLSSSGVINMAEIMCYFLVSGIIIYVFSDITTLFCETVLNIDVMSNSMIPVLYSLMLTMGKVTSYTVMHPTILFLTRILIIIINKGIFPLIMLSFALNITDNITEREKFKSISNLILKFTKWTLIFLITLFTAVLSAQNILTHSFDTVALKGTKFVVANFIPVVGGAISEGAETIGSSLILIKNATGIAGIAGVIVTAFVPVLRIYIVSFIFNILSVVSRIVSNEKIAKVLDSTAGTISMLGASVISVAFLFVVSCAIMLG